MLLVADVKEDKRRVMTRRKTLFGIDKLNVRAHPFSDYHTWIIRQEYNSAFDTNRRYHSLLRSLRKNRLLCWYAVQGEPIICTPTDAFKCFMGTELEVAVGNCTHIKKNKMKPYRKLGSRYSGLGSIHPLK